MTVDTRAMNDPASQGSFDPAAIGEPLTPEPLDCLEAGGSESR